MTATTPTQATTDRDVGMLRRSAKVGFVVWAVASAVPGVRLPPVESLLVLGVLVVTPLALSLVAPAPGRPSAAVYRAVAWLAPLASLACAAAFWLEPGPEAGGLAAPWMGLSLLVGWLGRARLTAGGWREPEALCEAMALLLLPIGGFWMLATRFGARPLDFDPYLVLVTALHFHFAVLVTPLVAARALRAARIRLGAPSPLAWPLAVGVVAGPVLVASGYVFRPEVGLAGTLLLSAGMVLLAWLTARRAIPASADPIATVALGLSVLAVAVSMPLACIWSWGAVTGVHRLEPWVLVYVHGLANGLGFCLGALVGWARFRPKEPARE